jgi:hypothetical protein
VTAPRIVMVLVIVTALELVTPVASAIALILASELMTETVKARLAQLMVPQRLLVEPFP